MSANTAIFTIVSANYIAFAATLMQSVRRFHPDVPRFIILSDARHSFDDLDIAAELIACDELGIHLIGNMKLWYSVIEFNTAVKPFTFRHLFNDRGFASAIYLDPDIQLYAPLDQVFTALADHSLVLTPHMTKPLQDGKHPSDLSIMKSGVYNLGFAGIANDEDGRHLVQWWCDRLFNHCRVDVPGNMFTDQRWMDLAPALVQRPFLLRDPGHNVAYWNLVHRTVDRGPDSTWQANGAKLVFFHFSGIDPEDATVFSKHQNRFKIETLGAVAGLCDEYRNRVLANGWLKHKRTPYAYATFGDGRPILGGMRRWVLKATDDGLLPTKKLLLLGSAFFDAPDEVSFAGGARLTRFAHQFWRDRPDLQAAFPINLPDGFNNYVSWFCDGSAGNEGVDPALIQAARVLRDRGHIPPFERPPDPKRPPWPAMSLDSWDGPARDASRWLRGHITFTMGAVMVRVQRQAALLWEQRIDLQQYFPLTDRQGLEDYHAWTLSDGMREGSIVAELFDEDYLTWLQASSSIARLYGDMPITHGMALTRRCEHARGHLQAWRQFPLDPMARLEQAFWYAFPAARTFGWPDAITAPVRAYFSEPSGLSVDGYEMSRGMVVPHILREDVRQRFDLGSEPGRWRYLCWVVIQGAKDYQVDLADLCPGMREFMAGRSSRNPLLTRLAQFAHDQREDLQAAFNLQTRGDLAGMQNWMRTELGEWLDQVGLAELGSATPPSSPARAARPYDCYVAMVGDWSVPSGIGEDLRTSIAALDACHFTDYVIVDLPSGGIIAADRTRLAPATPVTAKWIVMFHNADTALNDWRTLQHLGVTAERVAGHWLWELERLPARWTYAYSFVDEIWASSQFVREIFDQDGRRPVKMLHHAVVAPRPENRVSRRELGVNDADTLFLFMFDFASYAARKNPAAVIRAFCEAFPAGDEQACLVIKTQNAELRPELWVELASLTDDPRVILKDARLSRDELISLIASANAFVSLHRSEGFGRGPAEAMLLGVPVILTGYSGTADFTDESCACIVGYTLVPVRPGEYPGVEGQRWAEADAGQAAAFMRWVHDQPEAARQLGERGRRRAEQQLAPARIGEAAVRLLMRLPVPTEDQPHLAEAATRASTNPGNPLYTRA